MKKFFTLLLAFVSVCATQAAFFDFEDATANAQWQFIQDDQTNFWTIGTSTDTVSDGNNALYITNDSSSYAYTSNVSSVSWAYIPVTLTGADTISFSWKGGYSSYAKLYVYLFPEGTLPTAGDSNASNAIKLTEKSGSSNWTNLSIYSTTAVGTYNLCFMWKNTSSYSGYQSIAIDNVHIDAPITLQQAPLTYLLYSSGSAIVSACDATYSGEVIIPATLTHEDKTYSVTQIGNSAFYNCDELIAITIPSSVNSIGSNAFSSCDRLALATLTAPTMEAYCHSSINNLLYEAGFTGSRAIQINGEEVYDIVVPEGITSIRELAFYNCDAINSVTIPAGVTTISYDAFYSCDGLTTITIPSSISNIGSDAFSYCSSLSLATITAPTIEAYCNSNVNYELRYENASCPRKIQINGEEVTDIVIPEGVTEISRYAFYNCDELNSVIIPKGVATIGNDAFYDCDALTSVEIPMGVATIGNEAFYSCSALTSVVIPQSVATIGSSAFSHCYALETITIPSNIVTIGSSAFYYCSKLSLATITAPTIETYCNSTINKKLYDTYARCKRIIQINGEELTEVVIPNTVNKINHYAFYNCKNLTSVSLPESVTSISDYAFQLCTNLTSITFPESVTSIGNNVFDGIKYLTVYSNASTPAAVGTTVFDASAFIFVQDVPTYKAAWSAYKEQIFSKQYEYMEVTSTAHSSQSALHKELGLEALGQVFKLKVNGTINSYDIMMLRNQMPSLRKLDLADASIVATANGYEYTDGYTTKDDTLTTQSFTGTGTKIIEVALPKTLKHIEANAFNTNLHDLTVHSGTMAVGAFKSLNQLATVHLSDAITHIPQEAFYNCSALQSITLPETLDTIGNYAFQGAGLLSITIPANVSHLGHGAFAGSSSSSGSSYGYYSSETSSSKSGYDASTRASSSSYYSYDDYCYGGSLREVTIPKDSKLKTIPSRAFEGNESLTKLSILGDSITSIRDVAFRRCALDTLILPPNLTSLSTLSFGYCTGLKFVAMPKSLTNIPANAFVGCTALTDIQFSSKLTYIGHHAFADCTNLSNVDIPGLVTTIGDYAFKSCNVNNVYSYLFDPFTIGQNTFSAYANANATLYIPNLEDTEMKYLYDTQWSQFLNRVRMDGNFEYDDFYANGDVVIGGNDDPLTGDPNANLNPGSGLVVEGDSTQNLGTVTLTGEPGDWASLIAGCNLNVDTLILNIQIEANKWYFIGFPFQIRIADLMVTGQYVIYEYDAQMRAQNDTTGWKKLSPDQEYLYPGHGYIFNFSIEGSFSIKVYAPDFCKLLTFIDLLFHPSDDPTNQSWNYLANPFLSYYDINDLNYTGPITFWDVLTGTYQTVRAGDDEYYLSPYEAFFLQTIGNTPTTISFDPLKGLTKRQKEERQRNNAHHAPAKKAADADGRALINLTLSNGEHSDDTRVVINEDAIVDYEIGADAVKFMSTENVPQIFSYDQKRNMYAINERPMDEGTIDLGVKLPSAGDYTISCTRMDTAFLLLDRQENIVYDLQIGEYHFNGKAGVDSSRFALVRRQPAPTSVENVTSPTIIETTANGLYITSQTDVQIYSVSGVLMAEGQFNGFVPLVSGVYMVNANGTTTKHIIK